MSAIAVFDIGKTNVKLTAADAAGRRLETLSTPNPSRAGPPYKHHDVAALEDWLLDGLRELGRRYDFDAIVTSAHGSGGVLVDDTGPVMPMIDYEQAPPADIDHLYQTIVGSFRERGSPILLGSAHLARQMLWIEQEWPDAFARARHFLATPQYWAWRLSGVAAGEVTSLAAQSHLWCSADARWSDLVSARGWGRLLPALVPAWRSLGPLKPDYAARAGLRGDVRILCGIHDSSANLYNYQAAGLSDMTVVSTGTWIVALSDTVGVPLDIERPGLCCNADVDGRPSPGVISMGGREFSAVAGEAAGPADVAWLERLIGSDTMALPSFGSDDSLFPGTARTGLIEGSLAEEPAARFTLAVLYAALLTDRCIANLNGGARIVLDGTFVREPLYASLLAALNPDRQVFVNLDQYGIATGAALLASHATRAAPAPLSIHHPTPLTLPKLFAYRAQWLDRANSRRTM